MRAHMAAITQTHKVHLVMQQEHRARSEFGGRDQIGRLASEFEFKKSLALDWSCLDLIFGKIDWFLGKFSHLWVLLERVSHLPNSRNDWFHIALYGASGFWPHDSFSSFFLPSVYIRKQLIPVCVWHILVSELTITSSYSCCLRLIAQTVARLLSPHWTVDYSDLFIKRVTVVSLTPPSSYISLREQRHLKSEKGNYGF